MSDEFNYEIDINVDFDQSSASQALRGLEQFERRLNEITSAMSGRAQPIPQGGSDPYLRGQLEPVYRPMGQVTRQAPPGGYQLPAGPTSPYDPRLRVQPLPPGGPSSPYMRVQPLPPGQTSPWVRPLPAGPTSHYDPRLNVQGLPAGPSSPYPRPAGSPFYTPPIYPTRTRPGGGHYADPFLYPPAGTSFPPPHDPSGPVGPGGPGGPGGGKLFDVDQILIEAREAAKALRALREEIIRSTQGYERVTVELFKISTEIGRGLGLTRSGVTPQDVRDSVANLSAENTRRTVARGRAVGDGHDQAYLDSLARLQRGLADITDARRVSKAYHQGVDVDPGLISRTRTDFPGVYEEEGVNERARQLRLSRSRETQRQRDLRDNSEALAGVLEDEVQAAFHTLTAEKRIARARQELATREAAEAGSVSAEALKHIPEEELKAARAAAARRVTLEERAGTHQRTRDYFYNPDASLLDRITAGIRGRAPGETETTKTPFGAEFLEGFFGRDSSLTTALGQAAKFSVLYGGLYKAQSLVAQGFAFAAKGASDYEQALIALNAATGASTQANEELARSASATGTAVGFGPAAGVEAAARAVGLYDLNSKLPADRQAIAQQSVEVSSRIARQSGQQVDTVQEQLAGVISSFGLSPLDQSRVEDQLTVISRRTGRPAGDILNATAQLGTIADRAGYDPAEAMAMVAQIATTTGQSANAVAGQLSQVLSRAGDPAVLARLAGVGVDVQGTTLKQQIEQLGKLTLDNNTRSYTVQAFGRSRSGQSFDILLNNLARVGDLAGEARKAPAGEGARIFNTEMGSLAATLRVIGGHLTSIANGLADLGLFDMIKVAVGVVATLVEGLDNMVKAVNNLPGPLKALLEITLSLIAIDRAYAATQGLRAALSAAGGLRGVALGTGEGVAGGAAAGAAERSLLGRMVGLSGGVAEGAAGAGLFSAIRGAAAKRAAAQATAQATAQAAAAGEQLELFAAADMAKLGAAEQLSLFPAAAVAAPAAAEVAAPTALVGGGAGAGLASSALPAAIVAAGIYGQIQGVVGGGRAGDSALDADRSARQAAGAAGTPQEMRDAASRLDEAVKQAQKNQEISFRSFMEQGSAPISRRFGALIGDATANPFAKIEADDQAAAADLRKQADDLEKATAAAVKANPAAAFGDFENADQVSNALKLMSEQGYSASRQLNAINTAFENMITVGQRVPGAAAIITTGMEAQFTSSAASIPGKSGLAVAGTLQNNAKALRRNWFGRTLDAIGFDNLPGLGGFGQQKAAYDATQQDIDAYKAVDQSRLKSDTQGAIQDVIGSAKTDSHGQLLLSQQDVDAMQAGIRRTVIDNLKATHKPFSQELVDRLANEETAQLQALLAQYGAGPATPENIGSYMQATVGLAQSSAQQVGAIARNPTAGPQEYLRQLEHAKADIRNRIDQLPQNTAGERAVYFQQMADRMQEIDALIASTMDADVQARFGQIDMIVAMRSSNYATGDTMGRLDEQIAGIKQKLALTASPSVVQAIADATAAVTPPVSTQPGGLTPDVVGQLGAFGVSTDNLSGLSPQVQSQLGAFGINPSTQVAGSNTPPPPPPPPVEELSQYEKYQLQIQLKEAEAQKAEGARQERLNRGLLAVAPGDAKGQADAKYAAAAKDLADARRGPASSLYLSQLELAARQARGEKYAADLGDQAIDYASKLDVDDPLASQKNALTAATNQLALARRGFVDQREAQMAYNKANHDLIEAQIELAGATRHDYDRTNPLQQARAELDTLHAQYNAATNVDERARLRNQIEEKGSRADVTESEQRIQAIDDQEQLHQITHQAAQAARIAEKGRIDAELAGMTQEQTGYYALQQRSVALAKEIQQVSQQYSGQFNLRDIKLPTVYEIRRSIGATNGDIRNTVGDSVTNNVQINGADFAAVVSYLNSILGRTSQPVRGYSSRAVG